MMASRILLLIRCTVLQEHWQSIKSVPPPDLFTASSEQGTVWWALTILKIFLLLSNMTRLPCFRFSHSLARTIGGTDSNFQ